MKKQFPELNAVLIMKIPSGEKRRILKHAILERRQMSSFVRKVVMEYIDRKEA